MTTPTSIFSCVYALPATSQLVIEVVIWYQVCETLDRRSGLESTEMWPQAPVPPPQADTSQAGEGQGGVSDDGDTAPREASWEDWPVQAKLAMVLDHLRQTHHYCIFCGCQVSTFM